jgi:hypothetical protein
MIAARNRTLDDAIVVCAGAALVCSFLPWTVDERHRTIDAWQGSAGWPIMVCVALVAALTWLLARRRWLRAVCAVVAAGAGVSALAYVAVEPVTRVEPPGYLGIGMIVSLAILLAGDGLRGRSSTAQVVLGVGGGLLATLCALPWAFDPHGGGDVAALWHASAVWTATVAVVVAALTAVLIRDSRSTRLLAALPAVTAAAWALVFTLAQPYVRSPDRFAPSTVAIAKFTSPPRLIATTFDLRGVLEYGVVGCGVMAALALVLLVAAVVAVRTSASRER